MSQNQENTTSVSLDEDVDHYRKAECDNFSRLVNKLVRAYMQNGQQIAGAQELRKEQLTSEIKALKKELEIKTGELEQIEDSPDQETAEYKETLEGKATLYPDPKSDGVKEIAEKFNKEPETVAQDLGDMFDKEVPDNDGLDY